MLPKVILEIKFISIVINLNFDSHKGFLEIFYGLFQNLFDKIWHIFQRASE